jgi:hypothetical protein
MAVPIRPAKNAQAGSGVERSRLRTRRSRRPVIVMVRLT